MYAFSSARSIPGDYGCDRGSLIEETDLEQGSQGGLCADVCYFGTRKMVGGELEIKRDRCFGCGLCLDVCPVDCIKMIERTAAA